jgi:hypothetical protein
MRAGYTVDDQATEAVQLVVTAVSDGQRTKDHAELDVVVSGFSGLVSSQSPMRCRYAKSFHALVLLSVSADLI